MNSEYGLMATGSHENWSVDIEEHLSQEDFLLEIAHRDVDLQCHFPRLGEVVSLADFLLSAPNDRENRAGSLECMGMLFAVDETRFQIRHLTSDSTLLNIRLPLGEASSLGLAIRDAVSDIEQR